MKNIFLFIILLTAVSCSSTQKQDKSILEIEKEIKDITSYWTPVDISWEKIGNPEFILSFKDYIILTSDGENMIYVYNTATSKSLTTGRNGRGPNEILNINQIGIYPAGNENSFYIHDNFNDRIQVYIIEGDSLILSEIIQKEGWISFGFDTNLMMGITKDSDGRFTFQNETDNSKMSVGDYDKFDLETRIGKLKYQGHISVNSDRKRFACLSFYGEAFNIVDYSDLDQIGMVCDKIYKDSKFESSSFAFAPETKIGFIDLTSNSDLLFALCGNKKIRDFTTQNRDILYCNDICVFDWDGNYVMRYSSETPLRGISYNIQSQELYAISLNKNAEYEIVKANMGSINSFIPKQN